MRFRILLTLILFVAGTAYSMEFMESSDIEIGMTGYGLSVFKGWEPAEFEVEVIDVVENYFTGGDLILVKVSGQGLEDSGVIAGMSGSPVYIDNKLIGAVAYTWTYLKEPIAGITPIKLMLEDKDSGDNTYYDESGFLQKISMPMTVSGFQGESLELLKEFFEGEGYVIQNSAGTGIMDSGTNYGLEPGDAVAVKLIDGDYNLTSTGTVTYVSNNDILIFGHPMESMGNVNFPICKAYIYAVLPALDLSTKMAGISETIGTTVYDGRSGVYCELGREAEMIPIHVDVETWENETSYDFQISANSVYFTYLSSIVIGNTIESVMGEWDKNQLFLDFEVTCEWAGQEYIVTNSYLYSSSPTYYNIESLVDDVNTYLSTIEDVNFGDIKITDIQVNVEAKPGIDYYYVEKVTADEDTYYAGDTVYLEVLMKRYKGEYTIRKLEVELPDEVISGTYKIYIGSDLSITTKLVSLFSYMYTTETIEDLMYFVNLSGDYYQLNASFVNFNEGMMYQDRVIDNLPEPYISLFDIRQSSGYNYAFPEMYSVTLEMDAPIYGTKSINIDVFNRSMTYAGE